MFNSAHERLALMMFWLQLVSISALTAIYFMSLIVFACLLGFIIIFAYYAFNVFLPEHFIRHSLTLAWVLVACLYGVSIALFMDGTIFSIGIIAAAGVVSHIINGKLAKLWRGKV